MAAKKRAKQKFGTRIVIVDAREYRRITGTRPKKKKPSRKQPSSRRSRRSR